MCLGNSSTRFASAVRAQAASAVVSAEKQAADALFSRQSDAAYSRTGEVRSKLKANKQSATAVAVLDAVQDVVIERGSRPISELSLRDLENIAKSVDLLVVAASK